MSNLVKSYFSLGLYTSDNLKIFVQAAFITAADFKDLTGTDYAA